ncbi:hypothetical protein [Microbacterium testaceum]|uniref:hypothetical protein n=1 Tax=Microbacterium testaceum TaxID=2033 RepID=UPI00128F91F0|nr:hypothetical protein [Microbacterium testaceum]
MAGVAVVVVVMLVGAAVLALIALTPPDQGHPEEKPTSQAGPSPAAIGDATTRTAIAAAATVAHFEGSDTKAQRAREYQKAGLAPELAETLTPVWLTVFDSPVVGRAHVDATGDTLVSAAVAVDGDPRIGVATAADAHAVRVPVTITCVPQYASQTGNRIVAAPLTATWYVVVDEDSQRVLEVDQPAPAELSVRFVGR